MATITKSNIKNSVLFGGVPYGNATKIQATFETNATGAMVGSDSTAAVGIGDVANLCLLAAGTNLVDSLNIVSTAFTALTTANIGFAYADGVDDVDVPQDADYFGTAIDTAVAARAGASNVAVVPVTLPKDAYLTVTVGGAAHASAGRLDVIIDCVLTGTP